jgi:hypothetical protein
MSKRYREIVEIVAHDDQGDCVPTAFTWRGATYKILTVLGHWREDAGYWAGGGMDIPQRDLWRVEARGSTPATGVYELVHEQQAWRLDRIWD